MRKFVWAILLVCACSGLGVGPTRVAAADESSVAQQVKQLETDWLQAMKDGDTARLSAIIADDWMGFNFDGSKATKQEYMDAVKSGSEKVESFEIGPMDVKVLGNVAVVQGSDTGMSTNDGKEVSGKHVWTDVYAKRGGKWQAVRSHISKVE